MMGACPPPARPPAASRSRPTSGPGGHSIGPAPAAAPPPPAAVRSRATERTGCSSNRPRPDGAPARPANISVHCRVLSPADRLRYSPGSLLVVVSASAAERDSFLERLIEDRASLLSLDKVR